MIKMQECIDKSNEEGGIIKPTGRRPELDSLPARSFIIMEAKIMKMAKKFLAVALAGVLALSVLTGCGNSVKSKDIADALTKMGVKVEQDDGVDKTAKETLKAIETIIAADSANKITLDNAVEKVTGKVISQEHIDDNTDAANAVKKALGVYTDPSAADAEKANVGKQIRVALVKTENATKNANLQAGIVNGALFEAQAAVVNDMKHEVAETGKLGIAKTSDGKYMLVVIVNDVVAK
mgnify:CR=1 FL=1